MENFDLGILDKNLDDIPDLPGFVTPINGVYTFKLKMEQKVINDKPAIIANMETIACEEQEDKTKDPTPAGTKFSVAFFIGIEVGLAKLKEFLSQPAQHFNEPNVKALLVEHMFGQELICVGTIKQRKNKEDPDKPYADVQNLTVA